MSERTQTLRDEIALREASILDAKRELEAGELAPSAAAALEARERAAIDRLRDEVARLEVSPERVASRARRRRRGLLFAGLACLLGAAVLVLVTSLQPRQPGASITGGISLSTAQRVTQLLDEAQADVADGQDTAALSAYQEALALQSTNATAMTQVGWLEFSAGSARRDATLVADGVAELTRAVDDHPRDPAPRLYYAIVADSTPHEHALALRQFEIFLSLKPSAGEVAVARPFLSALGLKP